MCNYCNKPKQFEEEANKILMEKELKNNVDVIVEIDKGKLCVWVDNPEYYGTDICSDDIVSKKIKYCPMCGDKL